MSTQRYTVSLPKVVLITTSELKKQHFLKKIKTKKNLMNTKEKTRELKNKIIPNI